MKDRIDIRQFVSSHAREKLVLCTLVGKRGSSYRAVGAKKVISLNGGSRGLLSGGCLEAEIEKTARERYDELPLTLTFDMLADEDRLLGYQTGCQGAIDILFERLPGDADLDQLIPYDPIELFIVGCGADADSYHSLAIAMGWRIRFLDYRRDLVERFGDEGLCAKLEDIPRLISSGSRVAVVLMTHNYTSDLEILYGLRDHQLGYLGCLGPKGRFLKLQEDLAKIYNSHLSTSLLECTHAPVGIFASGRSPEEIALAVVAQIHGLLTEVPRQKVWTVILAAGRSSRFSSVKALAAWENTTFLGQALSTARAVTGDRVLVVTGAHRELLLSHLAGMNEVFNAQWEEGMSTSLRCGWREVLQREPDADGLLILPVDHPTVPASHLRQLRRASLNSGRSALTSAGEVAGPPAYIPKHHFHFMDLLQGDRGLKSLIPLGEVIHVESATAFRDVDSRNET